MSQAERDDRGAFVAWAAGRCGGEEAAADVWLAAADSSSWQAALVRRWRDEAPAPQPRWRRNGCDAYARQLKLLYDLGAAPTQLLAADWRDVAFHDDLADWRIRSRGPMRGRDVAVRGPALEVLRTWYEQAGRPDAGGVLPERWPAERIRYFMTRAPWLAREGANGAGGGGGGQDR